MSGNGGSFLSRWSRRKRAAGIAPPPAGLAPASPEAAPPEAAPPAGTAEPAFDPASLPPLESLTAESDFTAFLREEVPAVLRRAALRRAWSLDATIRDFVGPADYAWDFNASGGMPGFSLDPPADVERLIAQAIGLQESPPQETPDEAETDVADIDAPPVDAPMDTADIDAVPANGHTDAAHVDAAPMDAPALDHARQAPPAEASRETAPDALPAPPPRIAEVSLVRRRHGGALPS